MVGGIVVPNARPLLEELAESAEHFARLLRCQTETDLVEIEREFRGHNSLLGEAIRRADRSKAAYIREHPHDLLPDGVTLHEMYG